MKLFWVCFFDERTIRKSSGCLTTKYGITDNHRRNTRPYKISEGLKTLSIAVEKKMRKIQMCEWLWVFSPIIISVVISFTVAIFTTYNFYLEVSDHSQVRTLLVVLLIETPILQISHIQMQFGWLTSWPFLLQCMPSRPYNRLV